MIWRIGIFSAWLIAPWAYAHTAKGAESEWVYPGPDGRLVYKTTERGDRIMDFSHAGYMGGGVALPDVPVKMTVRPVEGDNTAALQEAIDKVSALAVENGFRGAVLLAPGDYPCSGTITIRTHGVVLRGSGSGVDGSTIRMTGARHVAIAIGGGRGRGTGGAAEQGPPAAQTLIADDYVPSGTTSLTVADASGLQVGDTISIRRPTTAAWVRFMGMDTLTRNDNKQTWISLTRRGTQERRITAVHANTLTLDVPLADSYDARFLHPPGTTVSRVRPSSPISQVGIEHLHIRCPALETAYGNAPYSAIRMDCQDSWVRDVYCRETMNSIVPRGRRITLERVRVTHTYANLGASKPSDFSLEGSQILVDRCEITGDNMYFVWTGSLIAGPNVLLNCTFRGRGSRIQPHQRWATGLLIDNCTVPDGGIDLPNRGAAGSGHGWTLGWGVVWNSVASFFVIQNPPGAPNWAIGCVGDRLRTARYFDTSPVLPEGIFDSHGTPVTPQSLYLAQLADRLGPEALMNGGYASNTAAMFPNKSVARLPLWKDADPELGMNLGLRWPVNTSGRPESREHAGEKACDGNDDTYWATQGHRPSIELDTEGPVDIDASMIKEAKGMEGRVQSYRIEGFVNSRYEVLCEGTTVGARKVDRLPKTTVWKVRLTILEASGAPAISTFAFYLSPTETVP